MWDETTYRFPNSNGCTLNVWEWMRNFIPHFTMRIFTYPCSWAEPQISGILYMSIDVTSIICTIPPWDRISEFAWKIHNLVSFWSCDPWEICISNTVEETHAKFQSHSIYLTHLQSRDFEIPRDLLTTASITSSDETLLLLWDSYSTCHNWFALISYGLCGVIT